MNPPLDTERVDARVAASLNDHAMGFSLSMSVMILVALNLTGPILTALDINVIRLIVQQFNEAQTN